MGSALAAPFYALEIRRVRGRIVKLLKLRIKFHNWLLCLGCSSEKLPILKIENLYCPKKQVYRDVTHAYKIFSSMYMILLPCMPESGRKNEE